ncbi:MAG: hypothetical protein PHQ12_13245 [Chthoniobacteraceae bacterium]|nr:hypothetical protein [Chthoniobacteraceae bacterium]
MNSSTPDLDYQPSQPMSGFLPITLLGVSLALVLIFQISMLLPQRDALRQALVQSEKPVEQSKLVQAALQRLVTDVYTAAPDDKDAQAIIAKYGIRMDGTAANAAAAPAASPASSPAK